MRFSLSLLLCFFACFSLILSSDVLDLTSANFDTTLQENDIILVEFFAPWCGHCKNLAPKFEIAATQLKDIAKIAKVDCTAEESVCSRFGIRGYPTLKVFREGKPSDYEGAREADAIVSFMKKQLLPPVSILEGDKIKDFIESEKVVIVGFFNSEQDAEYKTFFETGKSLRDDYLFGITVSESAAKEFDVEAPAIVLFKKFDEGKNQFEGSFTKALISAFVKSNAVPTMDDIGPTNYQKFVDAGLPLAYLFVTPDSRRSAGSVVEQVAREFKGKVNFVYIDAEQYGGHAGNLNLKQGEWPAFAIQNQKENLKYPFSGELSVERIRAHVQGVLDGSISPSVKSQEVPASQGNVKVVVGRNYEEIMGQKKDVLIEFYAPWCGHCKKLTPIWDQLGDAYASNDNIIIAKMDTTENDLPAGTPFQIQGFPTIKFFSSDGKIVDYNGDRTLEDFKKFLDENATKKVVAQPTKDEL